VRELSGRGDPGLVIPAYALYILLTFVALVPSNWVSRRMESEADRTSLALTRDPDTFISTETRLARENLSNVLPPAWVEFTLYTHPSNARRILMAERFK
jgi:STE24 endopeptidase